MHHLYSDIRTIFNGRSLKQSIDHNIMRNPNSMFLVPFTDDEVLKVTSKLKGNFPLAIHTYPIQLKHFRYTYTNVNKMQ
jgi:hypothetical protein